MEKVPRAEAYRNTCEYFCVTVASSGQRKIPSNIFGKPGWGHVRAEVSLPYPELCDSGPLQEHSHRASD